MSFSRARAESFKLIILLRLRAIGQLTGLGRPGPGLRAGPGVDPTSVLAALRADSPGGGTLSLSHGDWHGHDSRGEWDFQVASAAATGS